VRSFVLTLFLAQLSVQRDISLFNWCNPAPKKQRIAVAYSRGDDGELGEKLISLTRFRTYAILFGNFAYWESNILAWEQL